jgi:hypothetical protein
MRTPLPLVAIRGRDAGVYSGVRARRGITQSRTASEAAMRIMCNDIGWLLDYVEDLRRELAAATGQEYHP